MTTRTSFTLENESEKDYVPLQSLSSLTPLGEGQFGTVFQATLAGFHRRDVAVKKLKGLFCFRYM